MPGILILRSRFFRVIALLGILYPASSVAQLWTVVDPSLISSTGIRDIVPNRYVTYRIDPDAIQNTLWTAPQEAAQPLQSSNTLITVGLAEGTDIFRIVEYSMMEDELKAKYPGIKTFKGVSVSDPTRTIRADWTINGFRAVIRDRNGMTYIDPFQRNDVLHYIAYFKKDHQPSGPWQCDVSERSANVTEDQERIGDCKFRSYRLAQATTAEYSNFFGAMSSADVALVMAQVITAINRINEVYEADVAVRLILVGNTDQIFYYSAGSDPYNNGNGSQMLGQNQTTCDNVIGSANYDIGHVFSTGGGGVAYLNAICNNSLKAGGVTGQANPVGDPFYIDYVAHEMGHQFGGNHTQNNNCNRNGPTAMEPGSASTIMGYAGICAPNVQNNSDAYFHGISLQEIANRVMATNCHVVVSTANAAPVLTNVPNYTIPISTPFVLTATATDANGDSLSYCWEQWDEEVGTMPPASTNTVGPMFRSVFATPSPSRYFYNLPDLLNNVNPTWEELPSVGRSMDFRVSVRDFYNNTYGCTDEDNTIVTTAANSGPFTVTSQNSATTWLEGENQTITWNVANTTASPVSCAAVDIFLSIDGGLTYPTTLATAETNDGSAMIVVPPGTATQARVMVRGSGNIFFDINNSHITINAGLPNFTISLTPPSVTECNDGTVTTTVNVGQFMGFTDPVALSILNLPPGAVAVFVPAIVIPGNTSTLTITNLGGLFGTYTPIVRGTSTTGNKDANFPITLLQAPTVAPTLTTPANNATNILITPLLDWSPVSGVTQFQYQVALDQNFEHVVVSGIVGADQYQVTSGLNVLAPYFWRVRSTNICGNSTWSSTFSFTTNSCFALLSPNVPVAIPESGTPTVTSTFTTPIELTINDVNIITLTGTHTYIDDLRFYLKAPSNTEVLFWDRPCNNHDNFNINFDDEAGNSPHPCPPTNGLTYRPANQLTPFDGQQSNGTWTMTIQDLFDIDGGSLNTWGLKVCGTMNCQLIVTQLTGSGAGSLPAAVTCAEAGDTIFLSASLANQTLNIGATALNINKNLVIKALGANTNVTCSGPRVFEVNTGIQGSLIGMTVTAGTDVTAGAIANAGILKLTNVNVEKNPSFPGATLIENKVGSQIVVGGSCFINQ